MSWSRALTRPPGPDGAIVAAVAALIMLTADEEPEVRDWATFGLGCQLTADTPASREALAARLGDPDDAVVAEGVYGLALRSDPRATAPLAQQHGCYPEDAAHDNDLDTARPRW